MSQETTKLIGLLSRGNSAPQPHDPAPVRCKGAHSARNAQLVVMCLLGPRELRVR